MVPTNASSDKPYRLRFEHRPDYLHVHIQSEHMELETAKKLVREAAEELKKAGNTRILAEIDVEKRLSRADRYWVISEFPELGYTRYKIALLYPDTDRPDEYDFSETVMANRGVQAMAFTSDVDAERWFAGD